MKPEKLIKIANIHSSYGESVLYTSEVYEHPRKEHFVFISFFKSMIKALMNWNERYYQRKKLSRLSDHYLKDIGLTRHDVQHEADKWFWQA